MKCQGVGSWTSSAPRCPLTALGNLEQCILGGNPDNRPSTLRCAKEGGQKRQIVLTMLMKGRQLSPMALPSHPLRSSTSAYLFLLDS